MKSLIRSSIHASADQHVTWNPVELYEELTPAVKQKKKDVVLALFGQELIGIEKKEKRPQSNLHPIEIGRDFSAWQPGEMNAQPVLVGKEDWAFIETVAGIFPVLKKESHQVENVKEGQPQEEVYDLEKEVAEILTLARTQADEIILEAQLAADVSIQQAQDEIDQQKKEAYQQGLREAQLEFASALKASQAMIAEVREWQTALMAQGEQILVEMVKEISQTMFGEGAKLDAHALQVNLNRIMESAQGLGDLNIFLNPRDARLLDPSWSEYQLLITGDKVKVIPSENITPGGCFVKGSMGTVDGRVETQLAAIMKSFEENKDLNG
jgi:flagellar assembly protein FliH